MPQGLEASPIYRSANEPSGTVRDRPRMGSLQNDSDRVSILRARILGRLKEVQQIPAYTTLFENDLDKAGLLSGLEELGILPVAQNPNPFDADLEEKQHEQWWDEHPEAAKGFHEILEKRLEILESLHIGAIIGYLLGDSFGTM